MNKHRGTFPLKLGSEEYTICFSINSLCSLEEATKKSVAQIGEFLTDPDQMSLTFARALLWSGLIKHHPMSLEQAGDLIEKHGLSQVVSQLMKGFVGAFPEAGEDHPPQAERNQGGNGLSSSSVTQNLD